MGFLGGARKPQPLMLDGGQRVNIVGEASYQDALDRICGGKCEAGHDLTVKATLVPEPHPYDPNAVMVQIDGMPVGYLCRDDAVAYQPRAASGFGAACRLRWAQQGVRRDVRLRRRADRCVSGSGGRRRT